LQTPPQKDADPGFAGDQLGEGAIVAHSEAAVLEHSARRSVPPASGSLHGSHSNAERPAAPSGDSAPGDLREGFPTGRLEPVARPPDRKGASCSPLHAEVEQELRVFHRAREVPVVIAGSSRAVR